MAECLAILIGYSRKLPELVEKSMREGQNLGVNLECIYSLDEKRLLATKNGSYAGSKPRRYINMRQNRSLFGLLIFIVILGIGAGFAYVTNGLG
jgi:hypothetical protein